MDSVTSRVFLNNTSATYPKIVRFYNICEDGLTSRNIRYVKCLQYGDSYMSMLLCGAEYNLLIEFKVYTCLKREFYRLNKIFSSDLKVSENV